jgi:replicative DNA helicase
MGGAWEEEVSEVINIHGPRAPHPNSFPSEREVIGCALVHAKIPSPKLSAAHFDHPAHRAIYRAVLSLSRAKGSVDVPAVWDRLCTVGEADQLTQWGGCEYLIELLSSGGIIANIDYHVERVIDAARLRQLRRSAARLLTEDFAARDSAEILEMHQRELDDLRASYAMDFAIPAACAAALTDWARPLPPAEPTGIADLDRLMGGLRAESIYVLNGPTGRGKSGLAIQIASHLAERHPVLFLASELSRRQCTARFAAQRLRVPWREVFAYAPTRARDVSQALAMMPRLHIEEIGRGSSILDLAKRMADAHGVAPFLFVDYLQHAARRINPADYRIATSRLTDDLATHARDAHATSFVVSSVSRAHYEGNEDKAPHQLVGAAKESGDVEFDAAGVLFLDAEPCPEGGQALARLHLAKSRFSSTGCVGLSFDGAVGAFKADPNGALTEEQRSALEAVRGGASCVDEVRSFVGCKKERASELVALLEARHLIARRPLRVLERTR